jgi:PST family polysaccharide transporter
MRPDDPLTTDTAAEASTETIAATEPWLRTLLGAALLGTAGSLVVAAFGVARTKVLAVELGPSGLGLYGQVFSLLAFVSVASGLGLGLGTTKVVAEARSRGERARLELALSVSVGFPLLLGLTFAVVTAGASVVIAPLLLESDEADLIVLAALCIPLVALQGPLAHGLQGFRDVGGVQSANILFGVVLTVTTIVGVLAFGLRGAVVALLVGNVVYVGVLASRLRSEASRSGASINLAEGLRLRHLRNPDVKAILAIGLASLLLGVLSGFADLIVRTTVLHVNSATGAGIYQALNLISTQLVGVIVTSVVFFSFTAITEAHARDDRAGVQRSLDDALRLALLLTVPVILAIGLLRDGFVGLLLSDDFGVMKEYLPEQLSGDFLRTISWTLGAALVPLGMTRHWLAITAVSTSSYVVAALVLVPDRGVGGAVLGYVMMWALSAGWMMALLLRRGVYTPAPRTRIVLAAGAAFVGLLFLYTPDRWAGLALTALGTGVFFLIGTSREERGAVLDKVRGRVHRG